MLDQLTTNSSDTAQVPLGYRISDWAKFQHYKHRNPPWIKLHFEMLSSEHWVGLDDRSRLLAIVCMMAASKNDGVVPNSVGYLKRVAYLNFTPNLKPLIDIGFLVNLQADASNSKQLRTNADPETETETEKKDISPKSPPSDHVVAKKAKKLTDYSAEFQSFWEQYPDRRNNSKPAAFAQWQKLSEQDQQLAVRGLIGFSAYCVKNPDYRVVHCERYLSQRRFDGWSSDDAPRARIRTA